VTGDVSLGQSYDDFPRIEGDCRWHVYRMLGKLAGAAFTFRAP
jgi:hypothetical protein